MRFALLLSTGLILAGCTVDTSLPSETETVAESDGDCVATASDFERLREDFRSTAIKVGKKTKDSTVSFDKKIRPPLTLPFSEPPNIRFGVSQNPFGLEYGWVVKLAEGCVYDEAKPGFTLQSVDFDIRLNEDGRIIDDKIHYKIDNK